MDTNRYNFIIASGKERVKLNEYKYPESVMSRTRLCVMKMNRPIVNNKPYQFPGGNGGAHQHQPPDQPVQRAAPHPRPELGYQEREVLGQASAPAGRAIWAWLWLTVSGDWSAAERHSSALSR